MVRMAICIEDKANLAYLRATCYLVYSSSYLFASMIVKPMGIVAMQLDEISKILLLLSYFPDLSHLYMYKQMYHSL